MFYIDLMLKYLGDTSGTFFVCKEILRAKIIGIKEYGRPLRGLRVQWPAEVNRARVRRLRRCLASLSASYRYLRH